MAEIYGRYKKKPVRYDKSRFILKKRGGGKGYVTIQRPGYRPPTPKSKPNIPYSEYSDYPFFQRSMVDLDRQQESHQKYAGQVGDWLGKSLTGLTGVDPNQPGYNPQVQQQFQANIAGQVGSALAAAGTAVPLAPGSTAPGGVVQGNNAFLGQAAREASAARSSAALQAASAQANLNTLQSNTYAQGIIRAYADMQAGLPGLYAQRRSEQRGKIDQFIMEFEERKRAARVSESIRGRESEANIALAYAQLGLDQSKFQADQDQFYAELGGEQAAADAEANAPVPHGFVRLPDGRYVRDPSVPQARAGGSRSSGGGGGNKPLTKSEISSMNGRWKRPRSSPPKLGPGWKQPVWDPGTKRWYAKRAADAGSSGGSSSPRQSYVELADQLRELYFGDDDRPGWSTKHAGSVHKAAAEVAYWVRSLKPEFVVPGKGRKVDVPKLTRTISAIGGKNVPDEVRRILEKGYMVMKPTGLYWK